jgi:hypothetical protein
MIHGKELIKIFSLYLYDNEKLVSILNVFEKQN